jgi:SlyX protein
MADTATQEQRLIDLESQIAIQNQTIDELSDTLRDQWSVIDKLKDQVRKLNDRLASAEGELHSVQPPDQPPPHY